MAKNKQQIKFEADISGFKSAIKESQKQITSLNKELKLNSEQLKGNSKSVDLLQTKLKELQDKYKEQTDIVENTGKALKTAKETFGENSVEVQKWSDKLTEAKTAQQKIKNAIDETIVEINKQTSGWIDNGKAMQDAGKIIENVGDKMNKAGNKLSIVSAGVAGGMVYTAKSAIDYESAFAGVIKTVDGTEEQLQAINDGILEMSTRMPAAATEIAGVSEAAGQLGIKTDDILDFTEVMINLGESTNLSADEAATALAKFANITNMSAEDYGRLGSVIVDLGNNFATTEADIVSMATRLAATGDLAGLSQSQIMAIAAAMSSVGIEAEAGGSAMSKLLKKIQVAAETGGKDLKNFASVAGVSADEFKKAFEEDAVNALTMFLSGLNDTERNGKSAIGVLEDMGLTEVRLSNTILSLSNASGVLTDAVDTANNAWKENSALQNEVDKRYSTTESQIEMLKNEAKKLAIEFGRQLLPTLKDLIKNAKPLLDHIADAIKKFSSLDDKTKKNVISIAGLVVALGPAVKVVGTLTSGIGKATSAIGKISEKIGEAKSASGSLTGETSKLSTAFSAVGVAIGGAVAAYAAYKVIDEHYKNKAKEQVASINEVISAVKASNDAWFENRKSQEESVSGGLAQLDHLQSLKGQLDELVDANGRVQEKDKSRVKYILNELNNALGTEIQLNGDVVESNDSVSDSIDKIIDAKKRKIIMDSLEERYDEAVKNKSKYYGEWQDSIKKTTEAQEKLNNVQGEVKQEYSGWKFLLGGIVSEWRNVTNKTEEYTNAVENAQIEQDRAGKKYEQSINDILAAGNALANGENMTYEDLQLLYQETTSVHNSSSKSKVENLVNTLPQVIDELNRYKEAYKTNGDETAEYNMKQSQGMIDTVIGTLVAETNAVKELTPELQNSWKTLAETDVTTYATALSNLDDETIRKIQDATGCVVSDEQLSNAFKELGKENIDGFKANDFMQAGVDAIKDAKAGVESISLYSAGESAGSSFSSGLVARVKNAIAIAKSQVENSHPHADGLAYVPYNGYVARLHEGERVLTKAENADYMANRINNNNNNVTVNIYPQTMTEGEMAKVSNYIERKWGRKS